MIDPWLTVGIGAAGYRLWRLLAIDDFPPVRHVMTRVEDAVAARWGDRWADGIDCVWCLGWWTTCAVTAATDAFTSVPAPWLTATAATVVAGLIDRWTRNGTS